GGTLESILGAVAICCVMHVWFCSIWMCFLFFFFFSSRRRHTRLVSDWSSDVCSSDLSARALGIEPWAASVSSAADIESAIAKFGREPGGGFIMMPDSFNIVHCDRITALAAQYRLPAISPYRFAVREGGLMSYGVGQVELFRLAASYVDRLLKGAKPAELPVQSPTKFELVINTNTAKALGIEVLITLLTRADEVIE